MTDLNQQLKLPIVPAVVEALHDAVEVCRAVLEISIYYINNSVLWGFWPLRNVVSKHVF